MLGAGLLVVTVLLVRNPFGFAFVGSLGVLCLVVATRLPGGAHVLVVLTAVQLALSVFSRADYLFMATAQTAHGRHAIGRRRDGRCAVLPRTGSGAALCGALSIALLAWGVKIFFRR